MVLDQVKASEDAITGSLTELEEEYFQSFKTKTEAFERFVYELVGPQSYDVKASVSSNFSLPNAKNLD